MPTQKKLSSSFQYSKAFEALSAKLSSRYGVFSINESDDLNSILKTGDYNRFYNSWSGQNNPFSYDDNGVTKTKLFNLKVFSRIGTLTEGYSIVQIASSPSDLSKIYYRTQSGTNSEKRIPNSITSSWVKIDNVIGGGLTRQQVIDLINQNIELEAIFEDAYDWDTLNLAGVTLNSANPSWTSSVFSSAIYGSGLRFVTEWDIQFEFCFVAESVSQIARARVDFIFSGGAGGAGNIPLTTTVSRNIDFPLHEGDEWPQVTLQNEDRNTLQHYTDVQLKITWLSGANISFEQYSTDGLAGTNFSVKLKPSSGGLTRQQIIDLINQFGGGTTRFINQALSYEENAFFQGIGITSETTTTEEKTINSFGLQIKPPSNFAGVSSTNSSEKTIYDAAQNIGSINRDPNGDIESVKARYSGSYVRIDVVFSEEAFSQIYDAATANKLKAPYTVIRSILELTYNTSLNDSNQYYFSPGERKLIIRYHSSSFNHNHAFWLQFANSDYSVTRYDSVQYFGGATITSGVDWDAASTAEVKIYDSLSNPVLGSITGDEDGDIKHVTINRITGFSDILRIYLTDEGWDKLYDANTATKFKDPYTIIKKNAFELEYKSSGLTATQSDRHKYTFEVSRKALVMRGSSWETATQQQIADTIEIGTLYNISVETTGGVRKLWGKKTVITLTEADFNDKYKLPLAGIKTADATQAEKTAFKNALDISGGGGGSFTFPTEDAAKDKLIKALVEEENPTTEFDAVLKAATSDFVGWGDYLWFVGDSETNALGTLSPDFEADNFGSLALISNNFIGWKQNESKPIAISIDGTRYKIGGKFGASRLKNDKTIYYDYFGIANSDLQTKIASIGADGTITDLEVEYEDGTVAKGEIQTAQKAQKVQNIAKLEDKIFNPEKDPDFEHQTAIPITIGSSGYMYVRGTFNNNNPDQGKPDPRQILRFLSNSGMCIQKEFYDDHLSDLSKLTLNEEDYDITNVAVDLSYQNRFGFDVNSERVIGGVRYVMISWSVPRGTFTAGKKELGFKTTTGGVDSVVNFPEVFDLGMRGVVIPASNINNLPDLPESLSEIAEHTKYAEAVGKIELEMTLGNTGSYYKASVLGSNEGSSPDEAYIKDFSHSSFCIKKALFESMFRNSNHQLVHHQLVTSGITTTRYVMRNVLINTAYNSEGFTNGVKQINGEDWVYCSYTGKTSAFTGGLVHVEFVNTADRKISFGSLKNEVLRLNKKISVSSVVNKLLAGADLSKIVKSGTYLLEGSYENVPDDDELVTHKQVPVTTRQDKTIVLSDQELAGNKNTAVNAYHIVNYLENVNTALGSITPEDSDNLLGVLWAYHGDYGTTAALQALRRHIDAYIKETDFDGRVLTHILIKRGTDTDFERVAVSRLGVAVAVEGYGHYRTDTVIQGEFESGEINFEFDDGSFLFEKTKTKLERDDRVTVTLATANSSRIWLYADSSLPGTSVDSGSKEGDTDNLLSVFGFYRNNWTVVANRRKIYFTIKLPDGKTADDLESVLFKREADPGFTEISDLTDSGNAGQGYRNFLTTNPIPTALDEFSEGIVNFKFTDGTFLFQKAGAVIKVTETDVHAKGFLLVDNKDGNGISQKLITEENSIFERTDDLAKDDGSHDIGVAWETKRKALIKREGGKLILPTGSVIEKNGFEFKLADLVTGAPLAIGKDNIVSGGGTGKYVATEDITSLNFPNFDLHKRVGRFMVFSADHSFALPLAAVFEWDTEATTKKFIIKAVWNWGQTGDKPKASDFPGAFNMILSNSVKVNMRKLSAVGSQGGHYNQSSANLTDATGVIYEGTVNNFPATMNDGFTIKQVNQLDKLLFSDFKIPKVHSFPPNPVDDEQVFLLRHIQHKDFTSMNIGQNTTGGTKGFARATTVQATAFGSIEEDIPDLGALASYGDENSGGNFLYWKQSSERRPTKVYIKINPVGDGINAEPRGTPDYAIGMDETSRDGTWIRYQINRSEPIFKRDGIQSVSFCIEYLDPDHTSSHVAGRFPADKDYPQNKFYDYNDADEDWDQL